MGKAQPNERLIYYVEVRMPLVLTRKAGEQIQIGDDIWVTVVEVRGEQVRLAITAPKDVIILRDNAVERESKR